MAIITIFLVACNIICCYGYLWHYFGGGTQEGSFSCPTPPCGQKPRILPEATTRRGALSAVLAAGAFGATAALPAYAAPGPVAPSATDRRVLDLWSRRGRMRAALERISDQIKAAEAEMPEWARGGPKYVLARGEIPTNHLGLNISRLDLGSTKVGWPQVADLDQRLAGAGWIIARPNVEDLYEQFRTDCRAVGRERRKEATNRIPRRFSLTKRGLRSKTPRRIALATIV